MEKFSEVLLRLSVLMLAISYSCSLSVCVLLLLKENRECLTMIEMITSLLI